MAENGAARYALIIACSRYKDPDLQKLLAPAQDAEALARVLSDPSIGGFEVTKMINEPESNISQEIETFFNDRQRDDLLLLYFSCHGIKDKDGRLYYAATDTDRRRLRSTAISSIFVNEVMNSCRTMRQILFLDCCYSGAFERGTVAKAAKEVNTGEYFGRGRIIITASDAMQYSFEGDSVDGKGIGSFFTTALVRALQTGEADVNKDGKVSYKELFDYVFDRVRAAKPEQTPNLFAEGIQGDIVVATNPYNKQKQEVPAQASSAAVTQDAPGARDIISELMKSAREKLEAEDYESAQKLFESVTVMNPTHIEALNGKALTYTKQEKYDLAILCYDQVLRINPKNIEAKQYMDLIKRLKAGQTASPVVAKPAAIQDEQLVPNHSSNDENYWMNKGIEHHTTGRFADAIECQDTALKINPKSVLALNNKGDSLSQLGRYSEAVECFDKALAIDSKNADFWYARGNAHYSLGNYGEAEKSYERALSIDPNHAPTLTKILELSNTIGLTGVYNENSSLPNIRPVTIGKRQKSQKKQETVSSPLDFQPYGMWHLSFRDKFGTKENLTIEFSNNGFAGQGMMAYGGSMVAAHVAGSWLFLPAVQSLQMQGMLSVMSLGNIPFGMVITIQEKRAEGRYLGTTSNDLDCHLSRQLVANPFD